MKLKVKNFGPIREAEVDLKPLTVFVGPSNTGKSYLAMLLYSVAKALDDANRHIIRELELHFREAFRKQKKTWEEVVEDDKRFAPVVAKAMPLFARMFRMVWEYEAQRCFGEEWKSIVKSNGKWPVSISVESGNGVVLDLFHSRKNKFPGTAEMVRHIRSMLKVADTRKQKRGERREFFEPSVECAHGIFGAMRFLPNPPSGDSVHYLPAIRGGIMQRHLMMVGTIVGGAARTNVPGSDLPVNGVLADFLQKLVYVGNEKIPSARKYSRMASRARSGKSESEAGELSRTIEQKILKGEIVEKRSETGYTDYRYKFSSRGRGRNIRLINASSTISELAPLVVFMRHYLEPPGDIFIVEEPEAHLHPAAQRNLASVLAGLVKSGVYVVVTTHSDMILEQLSNFVHAHGYPETNLLNEKSGERTISEDQTAVYSFADAHPDKGTAVRKIDFDEDTGMVTRDHLDESSDLYNETVDIFNTKQERAANDN